MSHPDLFAGLSPEPVAEPPALRSELGIPPDRWVLAAVSTHEGEEEIILDVHAALASQIPGLLTIIVPRHRERGAEVAQRAGGIDVVGAAISVVMFSTFVFALIEGRVYGWWEVNSKNQFVIGDFEWPTQ